MAVDTEWPLFASKLNGMSSPTSFRTAVNIATSFAGSESRRRGPQSIRILIARNPAFSASSTLLTISSGVIGAPPPIEQYILIRSLYESPNRV